MTASALDWWVRMYSSSSGRNLAIAFLIGQAAPSARPQIVVPGVRPIVLAIVSMISRSSSRPPPPLIRLTVLYIQPRPLAAGGALAAALVGEEAGGVVQVIHHRELVIHHRDGRRAQAEAAGLADVLEVELGIQLRLGEQAHADATGDDRLGLPPLPDAAGVDVDQLAGRDPQGQLDADLLVHVSGDAVQLGPVALGRAHRLEPINPPVQDVGDAAKGLDVVDHRRLAERPLDRRERRLDPGPAALAFEALDQARLLAADVGPGPPVDVDLDVEARPVHVPPQVAGGPGLGDRPLQPPERLDVLEPDVDVSRRRLGREAGDQDAFDQLVRVQFHQLPVVEGCRFGFIGVDAEEGFLPILGQEAPLQAGGEPCAPSNRAARSP